MLKDRIEGVSQKDVNGALSAVRDIDIPDSETCIDVIPDKFVLEDGTNMEDPTGSHCSSFTLYASNSFSRQSLY